MRENRSSGSEGGGTELNRFLLPLSLSAEVGFMPLAATPGALGSRWTRRLTS